MFVCGVVLQNLSCVFTFIYEQHISQFILWDYSYKILFYQLKYIVIMNLNSRIEFPQMQMNAQTTQQSVIQEAHVSIQQDHTPAIQLVRSNYKPMFIHGELNSVRFVLSIVLFIIDEILKLVHAYSILNNKVNDSYELLFMQ